ncbi:MAG TPA: hypothetical protein VMC81_13460, partial [Rhodocyclaceae bacterium]|nr:hypothetical protein [Rhodocyclaceae bacterium]
PTDQEHAVNVGKGRLAVSNHHAETRRNEAYPAGRSNGTGWSCFGPWLHVPWCQTQTEHSPIQCPTQRAISPLREIKRTPVLPL